MNYPLSGLYYYPSHQPRRKSKWFWIILILLLLLWIKLVWAAQEPNWDTLIPIIIQIESSNNPNAVSKDGCRGVAQFSKIAWNEVTNIPYLPNVYNPELSKIACKKYLLLLKKRLGKDYTLERLLASYNMGLSRLKKLNYEWWKIKETKDYVKKIMAKL